MTKKEISALIDQMVEDVATANGAVVSTAQIKVGGKVTETRRAAGGVFDLDSARSLLGQALRTQRVALVQACKYGPVAQVVVPAAPQS